MRILLDTNVIVSAILSPNGNCAALVHMAIEERFKAVVCPVLAEEYVKALSSAKVTGLITDPFIWQDSFIRRLIEIAEVHNPEQESRVVNADPNDDKVVACAAAGRAHYIVSGDRHLLDLGSYRGIEILPPAAMLALLNFEEFPRDDD